MNAIDPISLPVALPASYYTSPQVWNEARERIFFRSWLYVCHATNVPETGDYYAFSLLDQDLFVIRGREGQLRCFYNVCQHRG
ncbi:MAG: Rieske 2Fe-2S domain-containing protein, partial [Pseudomonadota bacterium]